MKNIESEEHLPPYHFLYFLFLRLSFLSNQTQLLQKKKKKKNRIQFLQTQTRLS